MSFYKSYGKSELDFTFPKYLETDQVVRIAGDDRIQITKEYFEHKKGYIILKAHKDNTDDVIISLGDRNENYNFSLSPGETLPLTLEDLDRLYMKVEAGTQKLNYFAAYNYQKQLD